ncbi:MAG: 3-oxoacyl-ACP reductase FabG [Gammaproteobacteria bacterium]|nr:3-oxoacyl-ACP reductase FabG [Gammaproteobacteria bacterium]
MAKLENEICLVTGASRGIGRAIAIALGECGATVAGTATTERGAAAIGEALKTAGIRGGGHVLDVTDDDSVAKLFKSLEEGAGAPTTLVNNAGITRDNLLLRMKENEWDEVLDADLKSAYRLCKAALRAMTRARHGRIINIASVVAASGNAGQANYAAAKAGLVGFSKSLAQEVASRNITVNTIAPGFIETDMTAALGEAQRAALLGKIPLARLGTPEDIAAAAVFLAGAGYITGATLHVNGGMWMA